MLVWYYARKDDVMTTVFDCFSSRNFQYLEISRGQIGGNKIISRKDMSGVIKIRKGITSDNKNSEIYGRGKESDFTTIHIRPINGISTNILIGNGVSIDETEYEIIGATEGRNFSTGEIEHIKLILREVEYVES